MRHITDDERRARLAVRHRLSKPTRSVDEAAEAVVGLHSSDPTSVYLSARARVKGFEPAALETALYERKSVVRMLGMRRTMFVVPVDVAAAMDVACTQPISVGERKRLIALIESQGLAKDATGWLKKVEARTLAALQDAGEATAAQLTKVVPELRAKLEMGAGKTWGGSVGMSTRVLFLLASEGRIVRGRPLGGWTSSQYRWAPTDGWLEGGLPDLAVGVARVDLVTRWLRAFGPGTVTDIKWWTGWTVRQTKAVLADVGAVEVELSNGLGYVLAGDEKPIAKPAQWVALLPGLDPTTMGWKERSWYLGDHGSQLFDRNGNAGPTVWVDGRIVGGWAQRGDGEIVTELLEPVAGPAARLIAGETARLQNVVGRRQIQDSVPVALGEATSLSS